LTDHVLLRRLADVGDGRLGRLAELNAMIGFSWIENPHLRRRDPIARLPDGRRTAVASLVPFG
jgi:hypothetical protein